MNDMHSAVDPARLDANWRAITIELDAPRAGRLERCLRFVRVPAPIVRLVAATPALRRSWFLAIVVVVLIGLGAADPASDASLFALLVMAPMVPVLGVALAYGTAADPAHEMQVATPMHGLRLVAIRAATVLVVSIVVIGSLALMDAGARPVAALWLLPALAVTLTSLAMITVQPPRRAATIVALGWFTAVLIARAATADPLAAFGAIGQVSALAVTVAAGVTIGMRRSRFDLLELPT
ncbi:MAG: zf-HC2 domain-containing protein [Ilumatobacter sp.]|nr:zf-HC2 domain-containing protein [Ilumatobacter sp.]